MYHLVSESEGFIMFLMPQRNSANYGSFSNSIVQMIIGVFPDGLSCGRW